MRNKCALITGGTGGLGSATARVFAREGINVMLSGFGDPAVIEQQRSALEKEYKVRVGYYNADLQRPDQIEALVSETVKVLGDLNVVVNSAVSRHFSPVDEFSAEAWERDLAVNLSAPFYVIKNALPIMKKGGWGRIVNVASAITHMATPNRASYVTTKTGLLGLTRAVATEVRGLNITCNAISPSALMGQNAQRGIEELMKSKSITKEEATNQFLAARKKERFVETVPDLIVFLCSEGGRDMNGAVIPVDLGATAGRSESPYVKSAAG